MNQKKKYRLIKYDPETCLYRICALRSIPRFGVKAGDLGGFVRSETNLSHMGSAWIHDDAQVHELAQVYGDAQVSESAQVYGSALVGGSAKVSGSAQVYGCAQVNEFARIYGSARVFGTAHVAVMAAVGDWARVYDEAQISGFATILESAQICGTAHVIGMAKIHLSATLTKTNDYISVGPVGSRNDYTTFFKDRERGIGVVCGCFSGSLDEFLNKVNNHHGDNKFGHEYRALIDFAKIRIGGHDEITEEKIAKEAF